MAGDCANGSTLTFNAVTQNADITSITFNEQASPVQVTALADTIHTYCAGMQDLECTLEAVGVSTIAIGDTGAIVITWNDGSTGGGGTHVFECMGHDESGSIDDTITTSLTFKPTS